MYGESFEIMTQERLAYLSSHGQIYVSFFYNKPFAASIDNSTYWVTNRVRELLRWYRVFSGMRGFGTTENSALLAYIASEAYQPKGNTHNE